MNYYPYNNYYQQQPSQITNKIYVTSKEDALARFVSPNTTTVYFLQDDSMIFEVMTDFQGKKNVRIRNLVDVEPSDSKLDDKTDYLPRKEFDAFKSVLEPLIKNVKQSQGGESK